MDIRQAIHREKWFLSPRRGSNHQRSDDWRDSLRGLRAPVVHNAISLTLDFWKCFVQLLIKEQTKDEIWQTLDGCRKVFLSENMTKPGQPKYAELNR